MNGLQPTRNGLQPASVGGHCKEKQMKKQQRGTSKPVESQAISPGIPCEVQRTHASASFPSLEFKIGEKALLLKAI